MNQFQHDQSAITSERKYKNRYADIFVKKLMNQQWGDDLINHEYEYKLI